MYNELIEEIVSEISYRHEGPVTKFVLITRALQLASNKKYSVGSIADALAEAIPELCDDTVILESNEY